MTIAENKIIALIKQYGHDPISCALLQKDLNYFETSYGILAYRRVYGIDISLGPPICAASDKKEIVARFLTRTKKPVLNYLTKQDVQALSGLDLKPVSIGCERWVDVSRFVQHPSTPVLSANKKADKAKLSIKEVYFDQQDTALKQRIKEINQSFLERARYNREMSFINRPYDRHADGLRRLFTIEKYDSEHQGVFGYVVLNPFYVQGQVSGYMLDIIRFDKTRIWGIWLSVVSQIAGLMQQEDLKLSLGYCPLQRIYDAELKENRRLRIQTKMLSRFLGSVHYIDALVQRKKLIQGYNLNRYMMSYTANSWQPMRALLAACEIHTPALLSTELFRSIYKGLRPLGRSYKLSTQKESSRVHCREV